MSSGTRGSNRIAASPATSGSDVTLLQATGTPVAIASTTGRPKPSYREGKITPALLVIRAKKLGIGEITREQDMVPEPEAFRSLL